MAGLTAREMEVLRLIALGFSSKEIAWRLGISLFTVKSHLAGIRQHTPCAVRVDFVLYAVYHGLITSEEIAAQLDRLARRAAAVPA